MSPNLDDAKFISFFGKWLFDLLNPQKSPQNREKVRPNSYKSHICSVVVARVGFSL